MADSLPISELAGVGSGGLTGGADGTYQATSKSSASNDSTGSTWFTGAGNRGYQVNIAFPGATVSASEPINQPMLAGASGVGQWILWGAVALLGIAAFLKLKGRF